MFNPDPSFPVDLTPSPNHGERRNGLKPSILLLHYTGMQTAEDALARLCSPLSQVSSHYLVHEDGHIVQMVPEAQRAWHAGPESWAGRTDINSRSIGIEIVNPGHDFGYPDFPAVQIESVIRLCRDIVARHAVRPERVLAHSDTAPARKQDPGEKFPWETLFRAGVGHWVEPVPVGSTADAFGPGARGQGVRALQESLAGYGYDIAARGVYDAQTEAVVRAFQRHFRPARVDGLADRSTRATLRRLIAALPSA